ncbi:fibrobacter succinogenes major paralogous domain-containing protein [bacterium]|nr:fibrobacter succinogenes major paralogous domain-containing protein [bacterium]
MAFCQSETYQPDYDSDGCITVVDLTAFLSGFGSCEEASDTTAFQCGEAVSFHGYQYSTVQIGEQCWFSENLRTSLFTNGDPIPNIEDDNEWDSGSPAYCEYLNNNSIGAIYGNIYNGHAVNDGRGICPTGWHVPTETEWSSLELHLGMPLGELDDINWRGEGIGDMLKADSTITPQWNGNNSSGFSAIPAGARGTAIFYGIEELVHFWTGSGLWYRQLSISETRIYRKESNWRVGMSVRCMLSDAQ